MAAIRTPDLPRHPHNTSSFLRFFFLGQVGTCCHSTFPVDHCEAFDILNPETTIVGIRVPSGCFFPGAVPASTWLNCIRWFRCLYEITAGCSLAARAMQ